MELFYYISILVLSIIAILIIITGLVYHYKFKSTHSVYKNHAYNYNYRDAFSCRPCASGNEGNSGYDINDVTSQLEKLRFKKNTAFITRECGNGDT